MGAASDVQQGLYGDATPPPRRRFRKRLLLLLPGAIVAWFVVSFALFAISEATSPGVSSAVRGVLDHGGTPPFSATTVLVLATDPPSAAANSAAAAASGPPHSDILMLIRAGGGHSARLSIPRDMVARVPGHGLIKIDEAYSLGGTALALETVKSYLGIAIDHVVQINFDGFPKLVNALGGIDYTGNCIRSQLSDGTTLSIPAGTHHLSGAQALAMARTSHNLCLPTDTVFYGAIDRTVRQQQLLVALQHRLGSPSSLLRLPWIAWSAPQALLTDMNAVAFLGFLAAMKGAGVPATRVLQPDRVQRLPHGGIEFFTSSAHRREAVASFLAGG